MLAAAPSPSTRRAVVFGGRMDRDSGQANKPLLDLLSLVCFLCFGFLFCFFLFWCFFFWCLFFRVRVFFFLGCHVPVVVAIHCFWWETRPTPAGCN